MRMMGGLLFPVIDRRNNLEFIFIIRVVMMNKKLVQLFSSRELEYIKKATSLEQLLNGPY